MENQTRSVREINPNGEGAEGTVLYRALAAGAGDARDANEARRSLQQAASGNLKSIASEISAHGDEMTDDETFYLDDDFVKTPYWQPLLFEERLKNCLMKAIGAERLASDLADCAEDECDASEIADWLESSHETDYLTIWRRIGGSDAEILTKGMAKACKKVEVAR